MKRDYLDCRHFFDFPSIAAECSLKFDIHYERIYVCRNMIRLCSPIISFGRHDIIWLDRWMGKLFAHFSNGFCREKIAIVWHGIISMSLNGRDQPKQIEGERQREMRKKTHKYNHLTISTATKKSIKVTTTIIQVHLKSLCLQFNDFVSPSSQYLTDKHSIKEYLMYGTINISKRSKMNNYRWRLKHTHTHTHTNKQRKMFKREKDKSNARTHKTVDGELVEISHIYVNIKATITNGEIAEFMNGWLYYIINICNIAFTAHESEVWITHIDITKRYAMRLYQWLWVQ